MTDTVAWQQPGLLALAEDDGHGDTCGPIIMLDYLHIQRNATLSYGELDILRARLINDKLMASDGSGMTMGEIVTAMQEYYGVEAVKYVPWNDNSTPVLIELRADIVNTFIAHQLIGLETHNAAALPGNQPGIQNHFLLAAGYKFVLNVLYILVCNGDTLLALAGGKSNPAQQPTWVTWDNLVEAQISSYAIWPAVEAPVLQLSQVASYFTGAAVGPWQCGGHTLGGGILAYYRTFPLGQLNGFTMFGLPKTSEIALGKPKAGTTRQPTFQVFERGVLAYDPDRMLDNPPGAVGSIYSWHIDKAPVLAIIAPTPPPPAPPVAPPNVANYITIAETALANLTKALGSQAA